MPLLYDWECLTCGRWWEEEGVPEEDENDCYVCGGVAEKRFTKLTTTYKDKDQPWGRSLYRSHDKGELIGKQKRKGGKNE